MELHVKFRKAKPEDLKQDQYHLKVGQTYALLQEGTKTVEGIFSLHGDEDPFILKHYLDRGLIVIPENNPSFPDWIKEDFTPE